ncbi:site-2 protease family protein [Fundidesulfovibrio soli]|uniref:site-2 protease family protein n=1 Tax=Fundidesulfovibrio soli TaxID=2922716 RepID=UPI001FAFBF7F|nr:site-2 protease family protein [Fundidesulfovibrio soli]
MFPDVGQFLLKLAIFAPPMLMAVTFHEVSHGVAAAALGDPTARLAGRLTLNPLKHLDPVGLLVFVITQMIGWAKPVPVDSRYFRNPRTGMMIVSVAGPAANFLLAGVSALALGGLEAAFHAWRDPFWQANLLTPLLYMCVASVQVNLSLGVFNLLPIPPLDGGHILLGLLPKRIAYELALRERWGFVIVLLLAMSGVLGRILSPVVSYLYNLLI